MTGISRRSSGLLAYDCERSASRRIRSAHEGKPAGWLMPAPRKGARPPVLATAPSRSASAIRSPGPSRRSNLLLPAPGLQGCVVRAQSARDDEVVPVAGGGGNFAPKGRVVAGSGRRSRRCRQGLGSSDVGGHELVLLHGQPGLGADWQQLADQLPRELRITTPDRPGYGASRQDAGGFAFNARAVLADLEARGIERAVLVGHSYGGGAALSVAQLAPERVEALVLLASVGPGCLTGWDRLLAAPVAGEVCALAAWWLTPWVARARLARIARRRRRPIAADEHVNWHIWGTAYHDHGPLWRTFVTEQRALVGELGDLNVRTAGHTPAGVAARRPTRHTHPGQDDPSARGRPAECARSTPRPDRPPPAPPWGTRDRGGDR